MAPDLMALQEVEEGQAEDLLGPGSTWSTAAGSPRRIDYLFVRCTDDGPTLDVRDCRLLFDEPSADGWASDHFGVVADLMPFR